jgi:hypothetical protein
MLDCSHGVSRLSEHEQHYSKIEKIRLLKQISSSVGPQEPPQSTESRQSVRWVSQKVDMRPDQLTKSISEMHFRPADFKRGFLWPVWT